ncbi:MAG: DEAD/DEAH box helicase family protein [Dysgonamonadaceae bacterium]|jgi:type III restriction enzyme|nr:DEAD/DEAH box helicase family protein [Dysgonamonadaceae bacterium]
MNKAGKGNYTPLEMAKRLSQIVNNAWTNGEILEKVTPTTADLLNFWFSENFVSERTKNFHLGQRQAILNAIYCHEILKIASVADVYAAVSEMSESAFVGSDFMLQLAQDKNAYPKYCVKMATGTGKTWVLNALLIWQYLNAKHPSPVREGTGVRFTTNFLLVAPGLIVYERLLDAFKGKIGENGSRDFNSSDLKQNEELFIPDQYRQSVYGFVQNSVVEKQEIGRKTTGDGMIAITNWHLLNDDDEQETESAIHTAGFPFADTQNLINDLLPVSPGITAGNALDTLDARFLRGGELDFLANLPDICIFNDEAHHIHEIKTSTETTEVEWQKALNKISAGKGQNFLQIDFSATPYNTQGSGQTKAKYYFPHIIVDFDLTTAMHAGLVKSFVLDKRKEIASLSNEELEFRAIRNERNKVVALSEGQRIMLRAGLSKLKLLEENFAEKPPKMLVVCEDTTVSPLVVDFLKAEGLGKYDVMQIDSDRKGNITAAEWDTVKQKLFNIDKYTQPKVIVSVLMLREGFDVSNVCVIVPLRSSQAPILLEQVLGRGLRLMWREAEYDEIKAQNRENLYKKKIAPVSMHDMLYVVEHPAFERFYEDLDESIFAFDDRETFTSQNILGDMITADLKENYADYDMFIPLIIKDKEETLQNAELSVENLQSSPFSLDQLKRMIPNDDAERFISEEPKIKTQFGEYRVKGDIFTANSYNEYLQRMLNAITVNIGSYNKQLPLMQVNQTAVISTIDKYIRTKLFSREFNPLDDNNWRVLMVAKSGIVEHIMRELSKTIYAMQNNVNVEDAVVVKRWFSEVPNLKIRENFSLDIIKSIYTKTGYPSNKGIFERDFLCTCDADSEVERIVKISETRHAFTRLHYVRTDGMLASYFPDFMVKTAEKIYVVETKAEKDVANANVQAKQRSAIEWIDKINELPPDSRMNARWYYVLLDDTTFYTLKSQNATMRDIFERLIMTKNRLEYRLEL